jgi:hypothetical protein
MRKGRGNGGLWKARKTVVRVFRPSHKPWKSKKPISTFPPPRDATTNIIHLSKPERTKTRLRLPFASFRLILGLEKTEIIFDRNPKCSTITAKLGKCMKKLTEVMRRCV